MLPALGEDPVSCAVGGTGGGAASTWVYGVPSYMNSVRKTCGYGVVAHYFKENGRLCLIWTRLSGFLGFATGQPRGGWPVGRVSCPFLASRAQRKTWRNVNNGSKGPYGPYKRSARGCTTKESNSQGTGITVPPSGISNLQFCSGVYVCARDARAEIEFNCS